MDNITRPMILQIGTPKIKKDLDKVQMLLTSAGYTEVEEGKFVHNSEPTLNAKLYIDKIVDEQNKVLRKIIVLILSDADSYVNQTIYNALATVFPLELSK